MHTLIELETISAKTHDTSYGGYPWVVTVIAKLSVKDWNRYKKTNDLGHLYGVDISNIVHRINPNIPAWNPTVDDRQRTKAGIKTIELRYFLKDASKAEALGLKVKRFKNGEILPGYNDYVLIASGDVYKL